MSRQKLHAERERRLAEEEAKAGLKEGHYNTAEGQFVRVWVNFYPKTHWMICDCGRPRGEDLEGTARRLNDETKQGLRGWL
jgi:hypothetical protein